MTKFGVLGATALSLSLAIAAPALAQQPQGRGGHVAGHMGGPRMGSAPHMQSGGAQANFAGRGNGQQFARGNQHFAARGVNGGGGFRDRGFGRDAGFAVGAAAAGVATGAALAAGGYGYGYSDPYYGDNYAYDDSGYYGDSYAYDNGASFDAGLPLVTFNQPAQVEQGPMAATGDASYCAQRYRSYDPASGTYLGYDGMRHPCM
jgi:BA14K-like protein